MIELLMKKTRGLSLAVGGGIDVIIIIITIHPQNRCGRRGRRGAGFFVRRVTTDDGHGQAAVAAVALREDAEAGAALLARIGAGLQEATLVNDASDEDFFPHKF